MRISVWSIMYGSLTDLMIRSAICSTFLRLLPVGDDDGELIAAHATDMAVRATSSTRRLATARSTASPFGWPKVSLTGLKPSRSRKRIAQGRWTLRRAERLAEQLADAAAVREAGEHVHVGKVGQPLLRLAHLGDVASDSAEAFEPAGRIDDRIARDRDPTRASRGLKLHVQRVERLFFEQLAAELGIPSEERRHRMPRSWLAGRPSRAVIRELM
jgi:hypothetical protein